MLKSGNCIRKASPISDLIHKLHTPVSQLPRERFMKLTPRLLTLAGMLWFGSNLTAQDTNRLVFLCFGQSNMEGFPGIEAQDKGPVDERFQVLAAVDFPKQGRTKGNWYPAVPPLCRPSAGLGPGRLFWENPGFQSPTQHQGGSRQRRRGRLQDRAV